MIPHWSPSASRGSQPAACTPQTASAAWRAFPPQDDPDSHLPRKPRTGEARGPQCWSKKKTRRTTRRTGRVMWAATLAGRKHGHGAKWVTRSRREKDGPRMNGRMRDATGGVDAHQTQTPADVRMGRGEYHLLAHRLGCSSSPRIALPSRLPLLR